jgi:OmpA-OmpF porin, OOP family
MSLRTLLLAATAAVGVSATAFTSQAQAQQYVQGFYVGGGLGINLMQDIDLSFSRGAGGGTGQVTMDLGYAGVLALGFGYGNGIRVEIEAGARGNEVDRVGGFGGQANGRSAKGTLTQYSAMLNVLWDRDFGLPVLPYIGAGVGYAWTDFDQVGATGLTRGNGDTGAFAYQIMLGASLPIDSVPGLAITAEYRLFSSLSDGVDAINTAGTRTGTADYENLINHSVLIGLRYAFNAAPAAVAAPVATAPAPARTYLVFFDWNQAALTDRARGVISEAAANAPRVGTTRIEVSGHTDTSGSATYNQGLSMRRAEAVAAELERRGIPRSQMVLQAFGQTRLLVPTADNVREPQNRRVEIVLR